MTTQQFIEKAIEGGLEQKIVKGITGTFFYKNGDDLKVVGKDIFLDPLAWQAIGKVEGWEDSDQTYVFLPYTNWRKQMHRMIDALCSGKTIEEFLSTL